MHLGEQKEAKLEVRFPYISAATRSMEAGCVTCHTIGSSARAQQEHNGTAQKNDASALFNNCIRKQELVPTDTKQHDIPQATEMNAVIVSARG